MKNMINKGMRKAIKEEAGAAFILVLILLLVGSVIITPLLSYIGTSLVANRLYETKANEIYAADSGIEDSLWQIRYGDLATLLTSPRPYDPYDYDTEPPWDYTLGEQINNLNVVITMQNIWIPKGITTPDPTAARNLIETGKLIITGTAGSGADEYDIKVSFTPDTGEVAGDLYITTLGIWLPPGYSYNTGSSNLDDDIFSPYYPVSETISNHQGGQAIVWVFSSLNYPDLPSVITFTFTPGQPGQTPEALSWVTTSGVADIPYTWDAETRVHKINSTAGSTEVEAYAIKSELQELGTTIAGDYFATGNTLMAAINDYRYRDRLYEESSATVAAGDIPADAAIAAAYLYWSGWIEDTTQAISGTVIFSDACSNFSNWANPANVWGISSGRFAAHYSSGLDSHRYLTLSNSIDLSSYTGQSVTLSFDIDEAGDLEETGTYLDPLYIAFSNDGGSSWSSDILVFLGDDPPASFSYLIPDSYLTNNFKFRLYAGNHPGGWVGGGEYAYVDNIEITVSDAIFTDDASDFNTPPTNWSDGNNWSISGGQFHGYGGGSTSDRQLTMTDSLDLSAYQGETLILSWDQSTSSVEDSDTFYFQLSNDGGASWSSLIYAFNGNTSSPFSYTIPAQYLTDDFRLRFYMDFSYSNDTVYIDNINIFASEPPVEGAKVNRVMFGTAGNMTQIDASTWQVAPTTDATGAPNSWSYSCFYDATVLVAQLIDSGDLSPNGSGIYTLGHVLEGTGYTLYPGSETAYPLATPGTSEWAYAGWSLIIIYSSPDTEGHQLYLFDDFHYVGLNTTLSFPITGFLAPDDTTGSHLTNFTGEGDNHYAGEYITVNGFYLSDATNPWNNPFNSYSNTLSATTEGVDIDDFDMSAYINSGDTSATIELYNGAEIYNLVYIILSFRSDTSVGGTISYLIK